MVLFIMMMVTELAYQQIHCVVYERETMEHVLLILLHRQKYAKAKPADIMYTTSCISCHNGADSNLSPFPNLVFSDRVAKFIVTSVTFARSAMVLMLSQDHVTWLT